MHGNFLSDKLSHQTCEEILPGQNLIGSNHALAGTFAPNLRWNLSWCIFACSLLLFWLQFSAVFVAALREVPLDLEPSLLRVSGRLLTPTPPRMNFEINPQNQLLLPYLWKLWTDFGSMLFFRDITRSIYRPRGWNIYHHWETRKL